MSRAIRSLFAALQLLIVLHQVALSLGVTETFNCRSHEFRCDKFNRTPCISEELVCNGVKDCIDGSDESDERCSKWVCSPDKIKCRESKQCIYKSRMCDGVNDCDRKEGYSRPSSDEQECGKDKRKSSSNCRLGQEFNCDATNSGSQFHKCIPMKNVCDGIPNCINGDDERNCRCRGFFCDGTCHNASVRCDGYKHCSNGHDERNCTSKGTEVCRTPITQMYLKPLKKCFNILHVCDGHIDENDKKLDEVCPTVNPKCKEHGMRNCSDNKFCVNESMFCDHTMQCPDGSDEANCGITPEVPVTTTAPCSKSQIFCKGKCVKLEKICADRLHKSSCLRGNEKICEPYRKDPCSRSNGNGGCAQICKVSKRGLPVCKCRSGFKINPKDAKQCVDIDECQKFGACSQKCRNNKGSFTCICSSGYSLKGKRCFADTRPELLVSTARRIVTLSDSGEEKGSVATSVTHAQFLQLDYAQSHVYFSSQSKLMRSDKSPSRPRVLLNNTNFRGLAFDWWRKLIFFTSRETTINSFQEKLMVLNITSGRTAVLHKMRCPQALLSLPEHDLLLVSIACGYHPGIYLVRLNKWPIRHRLLVRSKMGKSVRAMFFDSQQKPPRLYWTVKEAGEIRSCRLIPEQLGDSPLSHRELDEHLHMADLARKPDDLAVFEDSIFWVEPNIGELRSMSKFVSNGSTRVSEMKGLHSVAIRQPLLQQRPKGPAPTCSCGHVCIRAPAGRLCLCSEGYVINKATGGCELRREPVAVLAANHGPVSEMEGRVGSVAGLVIALLSASLLLLLLASALWNRHRRRQLLQQNQAMHFANDSYDFCQKSNTNYSRLSNVPSSSDLRRQDSFPEN